MHKRPSIATRASAAWLALLCIGLAHEAGVREARAADTSNDAGRERLAFKLELPRSRPVAGREFHHIQQSQPAQTTRGRRTRRVTKGIKPAISPVWRQLERGMITTPRAVLTGVNSWAYQLSGISPDQLHGCGADVAVVDFSSDGTLANAFSRDQVEQMRRKASGGTTKVVAYMSIGEAESYRDIYWKANWLGSSPARPRWLGPANDEGWGNNYRVRYWDPEWQKLILGSPDAYLDRLIAAGFDGVYLDIVDGFEFWQDPSRSPDAGRRTAADEMIEFVIRIARYAWSKNPNFYIIPQNGEALLESEVYRAHISAIGMEDIFFTWSNDDRGGSDDVEPNSASDIDDRMAYLEHAIRDQIPVLAVEYLMDQADDRRRIPEVEIEMRRRKLIPHFAERQLERLWCPQVEPAKAVPAAPPVAPPATPRDSGKVTEPVPPAAPVAPPAAPPTAPTPLPAAPPPSPPQTTTAAPPPAPSPTPAQPPAQPAPAAPQTPVKGWWQWISETIGGLWGATSK